MYECRLPECEDKFESAELLAKHMFDQHQFPKIHPTIDPYWSPLNTVRDFQLMYAKQTVGGRPKGSVFENGVVMDGVKVDMDGIKTIPLAEDALTGRDEVSLERANQWKDILSKDSKNMRIREDQLGEKSTQSTVSSIENSGLSTEEKIAKLEEVLQWDNELNDVLNEEYEKLKKMEKDLYRKKELLLDANIRNDFTAGKNWKRGNSELVELLREDFYVS